MTEHAPTDGFEVAVRAEAGTVEAVEAALLAAGALSLTLVDAGDQPVLEPAPGETPLWPELTVTGLFPEGSDLEHVLAALRKAGCEIAATRLVGSRDWVRAWMDEFAPMPFGRRLWIVPSHCESPDEAEVAIALDPGLAFGTGTHPTTALCLEFLDAQALAGRRVLDFGCGSGVLAIAAARLGAAEVVGIDIDPQAEAATRANAERNGVGAIVRIEDLATVVPHCFDVILANILAGTLVAQAPVIARLAAPGARLALSGILTPQVPLVRSAYASEFTAFELRERDGWALLTASYAGT